MCFVGWCVAPGLVDWWWWFILLCCVGADAAGLIQCCVLRIFVVETVNTTSTALRYERLYIPLLCVCLWLCMHAVADIGSCLSIASVSTQVDIGV